MRVLNRHKDTWDSHTCVDIMRGSRWGNPFVVGLDGTLEECLVMFRQYAEFRVRVQSSWLKRLVGKDLWCCCKPKDCHGDILVEMVKELVV